MYLTPIHKIYHITKNKTISELSRVKSIEINSNIRDLPVSTAKIVVPLRSTDTRRKYITKQDVIDGRDKIFKKGDIVEIWLGYKEFGLDLEFKGRIDMVRIKDEVITLELEDYSNYLKYFWPKEFNLVKDPTLLEIVGKVIEGSPITLADTTYMKEIKEWVFNSYTYLGKRNAIDILRELMNQTGVTMRVDLDNKLHVQVPYREVMGEAVYDTSANVIDTKLKYSSDRTVLRYYEVVDKDSNILARTVSKDGTGEPDILPTDKNFKYDTSQPYRVTTLRVPGAKMTKELAKVISLSTNLRESNDGYEGSIKVWGRPVCKAGYFIGIADDDTYQIYWIDRVKVSYNSKDGFIRSINFGRRIVD